MSTCGRSNRRIKGWMRRADQTTKVKTVRAARADRRNRKAAPQHVIFDALKSCLSVELTLVPNPAFAPDTRCDRSNAVLLDRSSRLVLLDEITVRVQASGRPCSASLTPRFVFVKEAWSLAPLVMRHY
jgi:hypothetical protein